VAPVLAVARDPVLAGLLVSLAAGIGTVLVTFAIARHHLPRAHAIGAAAVVAATPLLIDTSLATLSESAYLFWVMLALCAYGASRMAGAGLSLGMAAATRPEALAIAGVLGLLRVRTPRALARFALAFVFMYGASVAVVSLQQQEFTPLSRAGAYRSLGQFWALRESRVEYQGREEAEAKAVAQAEPLDRGREYATRLPRDLGRLSRHTMVLLPVLAVWGLVFRRDARRAAPGDTGKKNARPPAPPGGVPLHMLAAFAPLPFIPLFTEDRGVLRWLAPYVPVLVLFGMDGVARIRARLARTAAAAGVAACAVLGLWVNRAVIGVEIEQQFEATRDVARSFAARAEPGDRVADRKPYFAFYTGMPYVEIPIGPLDETVAHLARERVRYLSLNGIAIHSLRPAFRPLLYDRAAIRGELRYRQVEFHRSGEIIYELAREEDPVRLRRLTTPEVADHSPAWSPDGKTLAFRRYHEDGSAAILVIGADGTGERELVKTDRIKDALAWSPDGTRIAFAATVGGTQGIVLCDVRTGRVTPVSGAGTRDWNPAWCRDTGEILFVSERDGNPAAFRMPSPGGRVSRLSSNEPLDLVSVSPSGAYATWVDLDGRLVIFETATAKAAVVREPEQVLSAASWSADERQVVVEAWDWGSANVYLVDVRNGRALMLTRSMYGEGMPAWSPNGDEIVTVSARDGVPALWLLTGIDAYRARLVESNDVQAFQRPDDTRIPAPPGARRLTAVPSARPD
jgi:hypothetical protein